MKFMEEGQPPCEPLLLLIKSCSRTSLVLQWLRIHLLMQGRQVLSPVGRLRSHVL